MSKYTSIDLFSGPGGLCTGLRWAGIKALIAVEQSYWTVQTYAASHYADIFDLEAYLNGTLENADEFFKPHDNTLLIYGDINKVEISLIKKILKERFSKDTVDLVTGGAPCESFSMAGDRKEDDDRNSLYQNVLRIAKGVEADMFMFENVKGLFSKKYKGKTGAMYKHICEEFQEGKEGEIKYKLASTNKDTVLLKAIEYGVPQTRERLFLVGIKECHDATFSYPKKTHGPGRKYRYVTVEDALMDLPQIKKNEETKEYNIINYSGDESKMNYLNLMRGIDNLPEENSNYNPHVITNHKAPGHTDRMYNRIKSIKPGENMKKAYERLVSEGKEEFAKQNYPKKLYAARNRRLVLSEPSFTVTSHCLDEMIHPVLDRDLTPREAARLQSFPDWYIFEGPYVKFHSDPEQDQYEQIGDAIPPLLGKVLGEEIIKTLDVINEVKE